MARVGRGEEDVPDAIAWSPHGDIGLPVTVEVSARRRAGRRCEEVRDSYRHYEYEYSFHFFSLRELVLVREFK